MIYFNSQYFLSKRMSSASGALGNINLPPNRLVSISTSYLHQCNLYNRKRNCVAKDYINIWDEKTGNFIIMKTGKFPSKLVAEIHLFYSQIPGKKTTTQSYWNLWKIKLYSIKASVCFCFNLSRFAVKY